MVCKISHANFSVVDELSDITGNSSDYGQLVGGVVYVKSQGYCYFIHPVSADGCAILSEFEIRRDVINAYSGFAGY